MAKTSGEQSIPSALLDKYRATLGEQRPNARVQKRYPFRLPTMQTGGKNVSRAQLIQRNRFNVVLNSFRTLTRAERERWYAAMPPWSSLLWYYNYFILSGLVDVLGADAKGAAVIKTIQNRTIEVPVGGTTITHASPINPAKAVVMLWGGAYDYDWDQVGDVPYAWAWAVYPIWGTLTTEAVSLTWSMDVQHAASVALQVIEYL